MDQRIADIFEKLNEGTSLDVVRSEIAGLIRQLLTECGDSIGSWDKSCIGGAIAALSSNLSVQNTTSDIWLRLCLANLANALIPYDQRDEEYAPHNSELNDISIHDLRKAIDAIA